LFLLNARIIFLIIRKPTIGIISINAKMPNPGLQGPLGDIFSSTSIVVIAKV